MRGWVAGLLLFGSLSSVAAEQPFYLTLEPPPAPELSAEDAAQSFTLAPGFDLTLVAAEPLVEDPVAIRWDEHGNLYAVEMRGFMPDAYGTGEDAPVGSVVRLVDEDADGVYDTREVLLDKLVLPRAIAIVAEGLLVGEPPHLWLCPTATGDARDISCADKRDLGSYGDQPGSVEHAENGLLPALDNWLYSAKSTRRLRLQDGELIAEPTLFRGQWGITQDNAGRLFYNTNSNLLLGDAYDAQAVIAAGNTRAPGLGARVSRNDQLHAVRVNPGVNRAYVPGVLRADGRLNRPTSASGMTIYRGDQFQPEHALDAFVSEPAANAVVQLRLRYEGLDIAAEQVLYPHPEWEQVEFLASTDERFRPVDVSVGPDGALYVVDMYRGIIQDHIFLSDQLRAQALERQLDKPVGRGRIWRVTASNAPYKPFTRDLATLDATALVAALAEPNGWVRDTAQRLLVSKKSRSLNRRLAKAVLDGEPLQAVHALWTLEGRGALKRRTVRAALARTEPPVRRAALRSGLGVLRRSDVLALARGPGSALLAQESTLALSAHNTDSAVQDHLLDTLLEHAADPFLPSAVKAAAGGQELVLLQRLIARDLWNAGLEQQTGFVRSLATQGFAAEPASAGGLLDVAQEVAGEMGWLSVAVLDGVFEVTRDNDFERAVLTGEHAIFGLAEESLWPALSRARRAVTWVGDSLAAGAKPLTPPQAQRMQLGQAYFESRCATCHGVDGQGIASLAPPLADVSWVTGPTERLTRIILQGLQGPLDVGGTAWNGVMPGHALMPDFTDEVASGLVTFLHRSWGHTGRAVDPAFIAEQRAATADRRDLWTAEELLDVDINTHYRRYEGRYGGPGFGLQFVYNGAELEVRSGIFNGPLREDKEDHFSFEPRELRLEFVLDDDAEVTGVRMATPEGGVTMPRLADAPSE